MKAVKTIAAILGIITLVTCALAALGIFLDNRDLDDEVELD